MTDPIEIPRLTRARSIVEKWAPRLGMQSWSISVEVGRDLEGAAGVSRKTLNYDNGLIELQPWVVGMGQPPSSVDDFSAGAAVDDERLERLVVHELLHLFMRRRDRAHVRLEDKLPFEVRDAYSELVNDANEELVEQLARTLVALSPTVDIRVPTASA